MILLEIPPCPDLDAFLGEGMTNWLFPLSKCEVYTYQEMDDYLFSAITNNRQQNLSEEKKEVNEMS